jgi:peptide/nickel transport system substrate-binding protein
MPESRPAPRSDDEAGSVDTSLFSLSRRKFGVAAALAMIATACGSNASSSGPSGSSSTATASTAAVRGGSVTYAVDTEPTSWDIHISPQDVTGELQRNVFDSLVFEDSSAVFHPWLATSWEIAPDLKSYTFHLRQDVKFHDGTAFDANAVKVNFDRIANPATKSMLAASLIGPYTGTDVLGPYTVKVNFSAPFEPFLQAASTAYLGFYSPKAIAAKANSFAAGGSADVGTGPFLFTAYTHGESATYSRNPHYNWAPSTSAHSGPAYLDTLTIRFLSEDSVRVGALTSNQIQVARAIPPANVSTVSATSGLSILHRADPGGAYNIFINAALAPLDDINVRQAVQRGINVGTDVKAVYFGQYGRAWSPLSPTTPDYDASLENSWSYDPAVAGQLLDKSGWTGRDSEGYRTKGGKRLTITWPLLPAQYVPDQRQVLGQAIQADLQKIGIQLSRPVYDVGTYVDLAYGGKENLLDNAWARFEPDVLWLFFNSASAPAQGGQNATFIKDALLDKWTNEGRRSLDKATRESVYAQVQKRVIDLALVVPLYVPESIFGVSQRVQGLTLDPAAWVLFHDAWVEPA